MALRVVSEQSQMNIRKKRVQEQLTRDLRKFAANFLRINSGSGKPLDLLVQMEKVTASIRAYADAHDGSLGAVRNVVGIRCGVFRQQAQRDSVVKQLSDWDVGALPGLWPQQRRLRIAARMGEPPTTMHGYELFQPPRYARLTSGMRASSAPVPESLTRPFSST
jgi:hypothetical protein